MKSPIVLDITGIDKYSFSKLSSFHTCPLQYHKNYIEREKGEDNPFSTYGSFCHSVLEDYFNGKLSNYELEAKYEEEFQTIIDSGGISMLISSKNGVFEKDLTENYYESGLTYFQTFDGMPELNVLGVEDHFDLLLNYKGKKFMFQGFIDLVAEKDGELVIVDHKSKSKFKNKDEKKKYVRQLALYSIYASYKYEKPVKEVWFNQFRIGEMTKFELTDEIISEALDWAVDTIEQIEGEILWLPNQESVFFCENLCNYGRTTCEYSSLYEGDSTDQ